MNDVDLRVELNKLERQVNFKVIAKYHDAVLEEMNNRTVIVGME
jgi:hypothetical protein